MTAPIDPQAAECVRDAWTPGPWKPSMPLKAWDGTYSLFEIHWSDEGECVAEVVHGEANARLIAAAPCIADAGQSLLAALDPDTLNPEQFNAWCALSAAVAKATGEQA